MDAYAQSVANKYIRKGTSPILQMPQHVQFNERCAPCSPSILVSTNWNVHMPKWQME